MQITCRHHAGSMNALMFACLCAYRKESRSSWPAAEVGVGDRLLSCVRIRLQNGGSVVLRCPAGPGLGTKDVPVAQDQAAGDLPSPALGGRHPLATDRGGSETQALPRCLQLLAEADSIAGLLPIPSGSPADRQRGDRSGVQDGVHPSGIKPREAGCPGGSGQTTMWLASADRSPWFFG
jgi:hypothetical protein